MTIYCCVIEVDENTRLRFDNVGDKTVTEKYIWALRDGVVCLRKQYPLSDYLTTFRFVDEKDDEKDKNRTQV